VTSLPHRRSQRLLTKADLRAHLGSLPWAEITDRMERGQIPRPLWGQSPENARARWDLRAVDRALDLASSIPLTLEAEEEMLDRALGIR
jgi:hypothetical protein